MYGSGYVPMGARSEQLGVDVKPPKSILCEEISISGDKGVRLSGILVSRDSKSDPDVVIVYFQGTVLSLPPIYVDQPL